MRTAAAFILTVAALSCATAGSSAPLEVRQAGKQFSRATAQVRAGDSITFMNDDSVAHNVYAVGDGQTTDLGLQKPKSSGSIRFSKRGAYKVGCAIHPKMKMQVTVE
jgi:plastocyanin